MGKTTEQRNLMTLYIRDKYKPIVKKFREVIQKDSRFIALRSKTKDGLLSVAICELMNQYLFDKMEEQGMEPQVSEVIED